eukprot:gb/GECG01016590.1/.p1 GENE.gb/GECG01016590.1/~~gb/GECG01016590.1/.p1  ORF type:complete len:157 (+),score=11.98 gb/GECG01016590.1/:1-471(+)
MGSSQPWIYNSFIQGSVARRLKRFVAWEAHRHKPGDAWQSVPAEVWPYYQWVNMPCSSTVGAATNPWTWVKELVKPEDFVVVKLDIDTPSVELPLVSQFQNDTELQMLVDEFFFEKHHNHWQMNHYFHHKVQGDLALAYDLLYRLRKSGIRAHSWP